MSRPDSRHGPDDVLILPGSKVTRFDLAWLHTSGWALAITNWAASGHEILGICGGYQMLGASVDDPLGVEGEPGCTTGLNLLPVRTTLVETKIVRPRSGLFYDGTALDGFEIHCGLTQRDSGTPFLQWTDQHGTGHDGCIHGSVRGTYLHGLFDQPSARQAVLGTKPYEANQIH